MDEYKEKLTSVLNSRLLPEEIYFLEGGISSLLSDLFVNYSEDSISEGTGSSFNGKISACKLLSYKLPGTELELVFNADFNSGFNGYVSSIPFSISIYKDSFFKRLSLISFKGNPSDILSILIDYLNINDEELLSLIISHFLPEKSITSLVDFINFNFNPNPVLSLSSNTANLGLLVDAIYSNQSFLENEKDCKDVFIAAFVNTESDLQGRLNVIETIFNRFFYINDALTSIKELFIPKINARFTVTSGLVFPRNILLPCNEFTGEPLPIIDQNNPPKSLLNFAECDLNFATNAGFNFIGNIEVSLNPPLAQIGNTGIKIGFTNAKLDLSRKSNIPEADADGRPVDFIGVYVTDSTITFPASWLPATGTNASTGVIKGRNLLIGTGGISGNLSLEAINGSTPTPLINFKFGDFLLRLNAFTL